MGQQTIQLLQQMWKCPVVGFEPINSWTWIFTNSHYTRVISWFVALFWWTKNTFRFRNSESGPKRVFFSFPFHNPQMEFLSQNEIWVEHTTSPPFIWSFNRVLQNLVSRQYLFFSASIFCSFRCVSFIFSSEKTFEDQPRIKPWVASTFYFIFISLPFPTLSCNAKIVQIINK